jgi:hypothetical protein
LTGKNKIWVCRHISYSLQIDAWSQINWMHNVMWLVQVAFVVEFSSFCSITLLSKQKGNLNECLVRLIASLFLLSRLWNHEVEGTKECMQTLISFILTIGQNLKCMR